MATKPVKPALSDDDDDMQNVALPSAASAVTVEVESKTQGAAVVTPKQMLDAVRIILEENSDIPPGGLFISHNGNGFRIPVGVPVMIPTFLKEILDHAVITVPVIDPNDNAIIGHRDRMKYSYRLG